MCIFQLDSFSLPQHFLCALYRWMSDMFVFVLLFFWNRVRKSYFTLRINVTIHWKINFKFCFYYALWKFAQEILVHVQIMQQYLRTHTLVDKAGIVFTLDNCTGHCSVIIKLGNPIIVWSVYCVCRVIKDNVIKHTAFSRIYRGFWNILNAYFEKQAEPNL